MSDGTALSRGDRNRNDRLARLRLLLPRENAIVGIHLADDKQAAVVADHDSRVLARRRVTCRAWGLGSLLDCAVERAHAAGFASVTVACEPTGHRWRVLDQLAADRDLPLVCVQPLLVWRAREAGNLRPGRVSLRLPPLGPRRDPPERLGVRVHAARVPHLDVLVIEGPPHGGRIVPPTMDGGGSPRTPVGSAAFVLADCLAPGGGPPTRARLNPDPPSRPC